MSNATTIKKPTYLNPHQVAEFLGVHYCTATRVMNKMAARHNAQVIKICGKIKINEADFYAALDKYRI